MGCLCTPVFPYFVLYVSFLLSRMRVWSCEQFGETGVVLLGFLTLAVSVGNLSTRGLQVHNPQNTWLQTDSVSNQASLSVGLNIKTAKPEDTAKNKTKKKTAEKSVY